MKKYLTLFTISLCLFGACYEAQAAINTYPSYYNYNNTYRPIYNPYSTYNYNNSSYLWQRRNQANYNRILRRSNALNRLRYNLRNKLYNNYLSQLSKNQNTYGNVYPNNSAAYTNNNGTLTGYSVPVNEDVFKKLGLDNPKKIAPNTSNTDLYSSPSKGAYTNNLGEYWYKSRNTGAKTGVTIIYD